ncbi:hypothetical protein RRG08_008128 [Elysia crispata]|uniref:Uncharacterized protein n=1 Tax=Elysia crispata TaxID=231223 RepID=A0AAE0Z5A6_9GAST|nr:hypothetical protein RRG08_008128 [Elysia crispata]
MSTHDKRNVRTKPQKENLDMAAASRGLLQDASVREVQSVQLFSDSCGGENGNRDFVAIMWFTINRLSLEEMVHICLCVDKVALPSRLGFVRLYPKFLLIVIRGSADGLKNEVDTNIFKWMGDIFSFAYKR